MKKENVGSQISAQCPQITICGRESLRLFLSTCSRKSGIGFLAGTSIDSFLHMRGTKQVKADKGWGLLMLSIPSSISTLSKTIPSTMAGNIKVIELNKLKIIECPMLIHNRSECKTAQSTSSSSSSKDNSGAFR